MNRSIRPSAVAQPAANYELAVLSSPGSRMLHTAGIVGARRDGTVPDSVGEQAVEVWRSILAILDEAGFEPADIVSYTTYVVAGEDLSAVMTARDDALLPHKAASTLLTVPALARPVWKVETAVIAARAV